jgi:phage/plasmid-associated DNA primase
MQCSYDPELVVSQAQLDADLLAIAIENGTLDLKAMTVRPSRREDYITRLAPVRFDPDAPCPEWEKFLEENPARSRAARVCSARCRLLDDRDHK